MQMLTLNVSHTNCNAKERNEQACEWLAELCNLINPHPTFYQGIVHLQGPETGFGHSRTSFCIYTASCVLNALSTYA